MIIGSDILFLPDVSSTNTHAVSLLRSGRPADGTVIHTNYQKSGRGQGSNRWVSDPDKNLLFSVILYPSMINPEDQFLISMAISLGICDFLERHIRGISIKWPNDIYANNDKIAGILIESSVMGEKLEYSVAGIGLNLNQEKFPGDIPNPVSLSTLSGKQYDLASSLKQLLSDLDWRYGILKNGETGQITDDYRSYLYRLNRRAGYHDAAGYFTGKITGVSSSGLLIIEKDNGEIYEYSFGEIDYII
jgi:BirA family biotin operon repressor/biotin-[acetyl-CoA-carboxylase] ligase